ncbi:MAG: hypothetical protein WA183_08815 [Chthoniobacterales bacterium]
MKKKSASQTARKLTKNAILFAITALALCASPGSRGDAQCNVFASTSWTGTVDNSWFNQSNWTNGVPSAVSPTAINSAPTAQVTSTDPTANACGIVLGEYSWQSGNLSVDGGTLSVYNELHVGNEGKGTLTITNGGFVTTTYEADIAEATGSSGTATVDGTSSKWTIGEGMYNLGLYVGGTNGSAGGTGLLTATNGGTVSAASVHLYKSGTLTGNGTFSTTSGSNVEGTVSPNWTLTIGGDLTFANPSASMQCSVTPANLNSQTADAEVTGRATLNGRLSVTMTGTFTCGTRFTLLHSQGTLSNKFSSYSITFPSGQNFTPEITYDYVGNHIYLYLACNTD